MKTKIFILLIMIQILTNYCTNPEHKVQIIAHRGGADLAPENTLAAFENAMNIGVDMIEIDVILSKDSAVVVIHDDTIDRTSNGTGEVKNMTLEQIKTYDAGSWFDSSYSGQKIPELSEVLDLLNGQVILLIEIKGGDEEYPGLEEKVAELIEKYNAFNWVIVQSFNENTVLRIKEKNKKITTFYLLGRNGIDYFKNLSTLSNIEKKYDGIAINYKIATAENIGLLKKFDFKSFVWTVDDVQTMNKLINLKVDGIITDLPDKLLTILEK